MTEEIYELERAWRLAMRREQDAADFYQKMARSSEDDAVKSFFERLAQEELKHKARLEDEYRRAFEPDLEGARERSGVFVHDLHRGDRPAGFSWWGWEEEAFRLARELDVPIVLDISASWCHWCHVMDEQTYSDPQVSAAINADFIPIRVDTDERPDVNARYNMGGWPTTAFLTPDGELITGATFLTPQQFLTTALQVVEYYRANKKKIAEEKARPRGVGVAEAKPQGPLDLQIVQQVISDALTAFDDGYGGFGIEPKFPQTGVLELLLAEYQLTGDKRVEKVARQTLDAMASGGLYDPVEGGFFRYATTRDWSIPHYEKMAEDNARLLRVYLHAYQIFGEASYKETAAGVVKYLLNTLTDDRGYFYSSQDADEAYYKLSAAERGKRDAPYVDKTPYTNYNALLVSALFEAGIVLDRRAPTDIALKAADEVWKRHHTEEHGMAHLQRPEGSISGLLTDQVWTIHALLDTHEFTSNPIYLQRAIELIDVVYDQFQDAAMGGFFDRAEDPEALGKLRERHKDLTENAVAARAALRLHAFTGDEKHRIAAEKALRLFANRYQTHGHFAADYALAVRSLLTEPIQAIIVGTLEEERTADLRRAALRLYSPYRVIQVVDPRWEQDRLKRLGYPPEPSPRAYICVGLTCTQPTDDPKAVAGIVAPVVSPWRQD